ncbi:MAG: Gldg family protein [Bdellovibrionota bacterium]
MNDRKRDVRKTILAFVTAGVALALLFVAWVYPDVPTATYAFSAVLVVLLGLQAWLNQKALKEALQSRSVRYGTNAAITIGLVAAILIVVNFLNFKHYYRKDFTKSKTHSLSEQTIKIIKDIKQDIKLVAYAKTADRDAIKGVVDNYLYHTKKISIEYVDPDRDPAKAKTANIKKYGTIIVSSGTRDTRIEEVTEEKLTNAIIKVLKDKPVTVCFMTGHGEKSFEAAEAESYSQMKTDLSSQNYESKSFNLLEQGKIPEDCSVLLALGPNRAFFEKEITVLRAWLNAGGRALFALDPDLKGRADANKEIKALLSEWYIDFRHNLVLDPTSRLLGQGASVPLGGAYSKDHPVTRDFQVTTLFPLTSTLEVKANAPASLKTWWLVKSTPQAFAKSDFKEIATGTVKLDPAKDSAGPHTLMVAVEGTPAAKGQEQKEASKAPSARIVALGTSQLATNQWARHGANADLFLNAVSWLADDESLISIRPKEEDTQLPTLTQTEARYVQLLTMILMPGGVLVVGLFVWLRRRKL